MVDVGVVVVPVVAEVVEEDVDLLSGVTTVTDRGTLGILLILFIPPKVAAAAQISTDDSTVPTDGPPARQSTVVISAEEYTRLLQGQAAQQASHPVASFAQSGHPVACLTQSSSSLGPWVLDSGASDQ